MAVNHKTSVPKSFIIIIVLVIAAMGYYAHISSPETTVVKYFTSLNNSDYLGQADCYSVFLIAQQIPEYASMDNKELLPRRDEIIAAFAKELPEISPAPTEKITVTPLREETKIGKFSAVVVFEVTVKENKSNGISLLVKENGKFRILSIMPISPEQLSEAKSFDIEELDTQIETIMK